MRAVRVESPRAAVLREPNRQADGTADGRRVEEHTERPSRKVRRSVSRRERVPPGVLSRRLFCFVSDGSRSHPTSGLVHVDVGTGSVIKTLATHPGVDLFLLGPALPPLGVPVDAHRHAQGSRMTGEIESAVCDGVVRFHSEYMGRGRGTSTATSWARCWWCGCRMR